MKRAWHHYTTWEDWRAGMYGDALLGTSEDAALLLGDVDAFGLAARNVIREWPVASAQHLSDTGCNRRAWVGQSACCMTANCTRTTTITGWFTLSLAAQARANSVATEAIREWERGYDRAETLFG